MNHIIMNNIFKKHIKNILPTLLTLVSVQTQAAEFVTDSLSLSNVVVTGVRGATDSRQLPFALTVVDAQQLTQHHRTNLLPTLMEQVPGLMLTSRGVMGYGVSTGAAGGMMMRGMSSSAGQMMVLIDGNPQYNGVYGHSIADSYLSADVERVEVLRGPASVLYGSNAMGGVVNIVTRKALHNGTHAMVEAGAGSYGTMQFNATASVRNDKFNAAFGGMIAHSDNHRPSMGFDQRSLSMRLGYDLCHNWALSGEMMWTNFTAQNPGKVTEEKVDNKQWINRFAANVTLENRYDFMRGAISLYDNFGIHKIDDGYNRIGGTPKTDYFRSKDALAGVSMYETFSLWDNDDSEWNGSLTLGFDYQHIYGRAYYTDKNTGEWVLTKERMMQSAHAHDNEVAGYVQYRQSLTRLLSLDAGLRYDHHSQAGAEWVPQVGLVLRPMADGQLKMSVGKGFRNPTTKEMYLYGSANQDSLRAESMVNYEISWHHELPLAEGRFAYGVNLFYIDGKNMIQTIAKRNVNSGSFKNKGVEVDAAWTLNSHWSFNTNHSFLNMKNHLVGAPEYKGYLGASMAYGKWKVNMGLQQLCNLFTNVDKDEKKENVTLLNATVDYLLCPKTTLWVKGDNLLARKYEINSGYPMPRATFMAGVKVLW